MTVTGSLVQLLHRINRQRADLKAQLERGPKVAATARLRLLACQKNVEDVRGQIQRLKMDVDGKQLQMKEREQKIRHWQGQLNTVKGNREYQALKDQIAADTQANCVLSDEILELLEGLDVLSDTLQESNTRVEDTRVETEKIEKQIAEKKLVLESELARVEAELAEAEKGLSGDFKSEYLRLVAAKGDDAMAGLEGKCCSGCYQSLTPQLLERLGIGQPVLCPACGRLIYHGAD